MDKNKQLPKIALGAWSWGTGAVGGDQVFGNHLTESELKPVFHKALEYGLNLWDTAAVYGEGSSERILGHFLQEVSQDDIIISTKFTPQIAANTENAVEKMLNESMSRLHIDTVDLYWIHNPMDVEKWTPKLIPLAKAKKIKAIGVSNHNLAELKRANEILNAAGLKISAVQNHYSLLHRSSEQAGILDYCKEHNITFYSYMVLEQGVLTGRFDKDHPFTAGTGRGNSYNAYLQDFEPLIAQLRIIANQHNATPAQIAIAWAIAKGTLPIIGVTKVYQVEEAEQATKIKLSTEELLQLEESAAMINISTLREWEKEMTRVK
ncbi:aldo/keto reductase [Gallibacterium salpingitidis]|uniref:Aldo/keto reductase n=1 Tax=Gallibacterium salpingitidis TaxID=505341 RepID=A0A1A7NMH5_9PAST|nr:aldo/keto reductase [Gallibacterium salpingitidis]OBW90815.1 aldo/keto reductase [Gallibacterium salpingitidis]